MKRRSGRLVVPLAAAALAAATVPGRAAFLTTAAWLPPYPHGTGNTATIGVATADCYAPSGQPHGTVIARATSLAGSSGSVALQGGVTFVAPTANLYTVTAEVRYAGLAATYGITSFATTHAAMSLDGALYDDLLDWSFSVALPLEWLDAAVSLYDLAGAVHQILQGPEVKTHVMTRHIWLDRGEAVTIYAGVMAKTSAVGSFAGGFMSGEVKRIAVAPYGAGGGGGGGGRPWKEVMW